MNETPLTDEARDRAAWTREQVIEHMPELLPVIREFVAEGLISGWRDVTYRAPGEPDPDAENRVVALPSGGLRGWLKK